MKARLEGLLNTLFKIRPTEARRALLLFTYLLAAVGAFIIGRNVRDTLFLSHFTREVLVYMYISQAVVVALPSWFYAKYTNHFRRDRLITVSLFIMMAGCLLAYPAVRTGEGWVFIALYNWIELIGALMMIQFWTFASDVFSSREAKRLFPFIGGGGVVANVVIGGAIIAAVRAFGVESLLLMMAGLLALCMACVRALGSSEGTKLQEQAQDRRKADQKALKVRDSAQGIFKSNHLKIIALMTCITFVTVQFVDFQFKSVTRETFKGEALAQFYAYFTIGCGVLAATVQFGLSARILERFGVIVALAVLPTSLLLGNAWVLAVGGLWAVTFTQGAQASLRYSIYDATVQVLYTPVPANVRGRAKSFIDGILKPGAIGASGFLMWLLGNKLGVATEDLAWVSLILLMVWVYLVLTIKGEYVRELLATLRKRRLNFDQSHLAITDAPTIAFLRRTLGSTEPREVRNALELLPRVHGASFSVELMALLGHSEADIRAKAVALLGASGTIEGGQRIADCFKDPDEEVRAAAVRAFCFLGRERAITVVTPFLEDPKPAVRAAAVAGLIVHGGLDGILRAAEPLKRMLDHPEAGVRDHAARVLGEIRVRNFYQPVLALLRDESVRVQISAISAAGEMQSNELVPALVYKLAHRETAHACVRALARYGESILDVLGKVLAEESEDLAIRRQIPKVLAAQGSRRALELLLAHLEVEDPGLRREVARAAGRVKDRLSNITVDPQPVEKMVAREVEQAFQLLAAVQDLGEKPDRPSLLHDALLERVQWTQDRIFKMLAITYPAKTMELVFGNLSSPAANVRANAVEVLDNMLSKSVKWVLLPLVEEAPLELKLQRGGELFRLERRTIEERLRELMTGPDPWLRVCAVHEAGERRLESLTGEVGARLTDPDPVVRETAVRALTQLVSPDALRGSLERFKDERVEWVRRYADSLVSAP
ncbi:MAG: Npt1/Npt2 family nucleotide transporter [Myxococcota bacterium]